MESHLGTSADSSRQALNVWTTHILHKQVQEPADFHHHVAENAVRFHEHFESQNLTPSFLMSHESPLLARVFDHVHDGVIEYLQNFHPGLSVEDLDLRFGSRVVVQTYGRQVRLHSHMENHFVATYYPRVFVGPGEDPSRKPGAVQYYDPRSLRFDWPAPEDERYVSLEPRVGSLIVFPGYLNHTTVPFMDPSSMKVAIVTMVQAFRKEAKHDSDLLQAEEMRRFHRTRGSTHGS